MRYILGIDPAYSTTGYAVIDFNTEEIVEAGKYTTSKDEHNDIRMLHIIRFLFDIINKYGIREIMMEDGYVSVNKGTGLMLASLRGGIISVMLYHGIEVHHMLPTSIRQTFGIKGNASKEEVAQKIIETYGDKVSFIGPYSDKQNKNKTSDIYDAISIALSYIRSLKTEHDTM